MVLGFDIKQSAKFDMSLNKETHLKEDIFYYPTTQVTSYIWCLITQSICLPLSAFQYFFSVQVLLPSSVSRCPGYDTKLHPVMRLHFWTISLLFLLVTPSVVIAVRVPIYGSNRFQFLCLMAYQILWIIQSHPCRRTVEWLSNPQLKE